MIQLLMIGKLTWLNPPHYKEYEDYLEPVEIKQLDYISAEVEKNVDLNTKLINYGVKQICS